MSGFGKARPGPAEIGRYENALASAPLAEGQDVSDWEMREYFEFF
jgi:hypothetical protein